MPISLTVDFRGNYTFGNPYVVSPISATDPLVSGDSVWTD